MWRLSNIFIETPFFAVDHDDKVTGNEVENDEILIFKIACFLSNAVHVDQTMKYFEFHSV